MVGLDFGHHLGLPEALPALPLAPLAARYQELLARQHALGMRHIGELLIARGGRLRVLDGVYVPRAPRGWRRVDGGELSRLRSEAASADASALLRQLEEMHGRDPTALRRVLLYQLVELLQNHPQGGRPATAVLLGVDRGEAAALVHAAGVRLRLNARQRAAAEGLQDEWERGRLRAAARLAAELPADSGQDPFLRGLLRQVTALTHETEAALDTARRLEREGDTAAARDRYLHAARLTADSVQALRGLVRTHQPAGSAPGPLAVELAPDSVGLIWAPVGDTDGEGGTGGTAVTAWRVIRIVRAPGRRPGSLTVVHRQVRTGSARDTQPPLGGTVRYAVFPLRDELVDGPPLVSGKLLVAPEVSGLRLTDGRERIEAVWTRPPGAVGVRVVLTGPDGRAREVGARDDGFTERGLSPGRHQVWVRCCYRAPDGRDVESPGIERQVTVDPWPSPVRELTVTVRDGGVRFAWSGAEDADVRLVEWPGNAPLPGTELPREYAELPAPLAWRRAAGGLVPPPGALVAVTAVSLRGEHAVVGPSVHIEAPRPVGALAAERTADGLARVTFDWPPEAGQVTVTTEQDGRRTVYHVARSVFLREGLYLPVGPSAVQLNATAAPRTTEATVIPPAGVEIVLPADIAVAYQVIPGPRRPLRRKPATVRVSLSCPDGEPASELPEFVLVARSGDGVAPVRPRHPADGTTVLRLSGAELHRAGTVEREITPGACRPPYALRGFLVGGSAASVRLEDPSPTTLVVR